MIVLALCAGMSGCVSNYEGKFTPISMAQLIEKVRCELIESSKTSTFLQRGGSISADLKVQTKNTGGFSPSIEKTTAFLTPGESRSLNLPLSIEGSSSRLYRQLFTVELPTALKQDCVSVSAVPIVGKIGVDRLVKEYSSTVAYVEERNNKSPDDNGGVRLATIKLDDNAVFSGESVFSAKLAVTSAGITWVLTEITGVLPLSASNEVTGTIKLAFIGVDAESDAYKERRAKHSSPSRPLAGVTLSPSIVTPNAEGFNLLRYNSGGEDE
ncbi:hypothetical protein ASE36_02400 [Rhizobium sp. Root274]|uniref:hypothetical protein n=1 Tax=unclassified Rhizobium TaxID=2613769 RepID=UPI00071478D7|nr:MULTISPECIES: hypothetical protein [unclassified Rhizobium]KQW31154.1 hypothetical protein ASC71_02395 [Rhizobium sp. Root1240]KRD32702.1 hypothetical protein ASE36_02400 [Rhizobium sp. Root274]